MNSATDTAGLALNLERANALGFEHIHSMLKADSAGVYTAHLGDVTIASHFQPIFSLSHRRQVGHEALMRPRTASGEPIAPPALLGRVADDFYTLLELDRLCRAVHIANFAGQTNGDEWLFLNMHPEVFLRARRLGATDVMLQRLIETFGLSPHRLVIEVVEEAVAGNADFAESIAFFRGLGCMIAIDDFGAGHSNFDRIWSIRPEIVKLDRSLILQAAREPHVRHLLPQMVALLHEAGALVLMEGIETRDEAYIALEADIDFVQGFYFGRPSPTLFTSDGPHSPICDTWTDFDNQAQTAKSTYRSNIAPYINAIGYASVLLSAGRPMEEACASFLTLENTEFSYVLDTQGQQIGVNHWGVHASPLRDPRFAPVALGQGARWARRPYFRRAIDNFGKVQVTRPYLSISSAILCVTLSVSFKVDGELRVLCGDVRWRQS